jgi:hypothetical protein
MNRPTEAEQKAEIEEAQKVRYRAFAPGSCCPHPT